MRVSTAQIIRAVLFAMATAASLAGLPALSVPVGGGASCGSSSSAGTIPSMQLIGRAFDESLLLKVAAVIDTR